MSDVAVKICGIRTPEDAISAAAAGATMIGLVFVPGSPRCVTRREAEQVLSVLPATVEPVALFVDANERHTELEWWKGRVQLHGNETAETCMRIAARGHAVMKGFQFSPQAVATWDACEAVDTLVIDGPHAGSGVGFDHQLLAKLMSKLTTRVLLAGGLTPATVQAAIQHVRPWGVDVSSGVESAKGIKSAALISQFCQAARR